MPLHPRGIGIRLPPSHWAIRAVGGGRAGGGAWRKPSPTSC